MAKIKLIVLAAFKRDDEDNMVEAKEADELPTFAGLKGEKVQLPSADYLFSNILTALATLTVLKARAA